MNGILIVNKPLNCTSHDIVYKIKKITDEKVGHTGTLDPMAEGVLPILIGKGTLLSKYLINHDKKYIAKIQLGVKTDTADREGKIIEEQEVNKKILEKQNIERTLSTFIGKQEQIPPIYSAIKVNGRKLYEYARKGQNVEIKPRQIEIYDIKLLNIYKEENQIEIEVFCGKGTYIRTLCEDIAKKLGTIGYMKSLKRVQVGDFKIEDSVDIDISKKDNTNREAEKENLQKERELIEKNIISIEEIFKDSEKINLDSKKLEMFLNGVKLTNKNKDGVYKIYDQNQKFIGTGIIENNLLKRDIIL